LPTATALAERTSRKLLFWARPEAHTARNLFALCLAALRKACEHGFFPREAWELHAIGCNAYPDLDLPGRQKLHFLGRLPLQAYTAALPTYDVGLVGMFSPHPSVPNFELAASGVPTVTTAFGNRPATSMTAACPNLIVCDAGLESLVAALEQARARSFEAEERLSRAQFDWPRSWRDSFSPAWMEDLLALLRTNLGPDTTRALFGVAD